MVAYVYTLIILVAIVLVLVRMIMKKQKPSNRYKPSDDNIETSYTPYDDITMGTNTDGRKDTPIKETKHHIGYEENGESNKESDT